MFASLLFYCLIAAFGIAQADPDLLDATPNLVIMPSGSYVIPMNTALQPLVTIVSSGGRSGTTTTVTGFNLKAYGLVVNLLHANIPVRWVISTTKTLPTDVDFVAYCQKAYPTASAESTGNYRQFSGGPFFVTPAYLAPPAGGGASRADSVIINFGNNVAVYKTLSDTTVDLRYTLQFKPKIGVLNDVAGTNPDNINIHTNVLTNAGLVSGTHFETVSSDTDSVRGDTCFTLITEPHWDADYQTSVPFDESIRLFLLNGGNFFGQCEGIDVFENCNIETYTSYISYQNPLDPFAVPQSSNQCSGLLLTQGGLNTLDQNVFTSQFGTQNYVYRAANTAFSQFDYFRPDSGWIESFDLKRGIYSGEATSNWIPGSGSHFVISSDDVSYYSSYYGESYPSRGTLGVSFAAHGKLVTTVNGQSISFVNVVGGNIFYLGGHDYTSYNSKYRPDYDAGQRMYLNAMLHPANRPNCGFDIPPQPEEKECILFDPWEHADFIFSPGCIPHIPLDPGVGTDVKSCDQYIALPAGWEVVEMTTSSSPGVDPVLNPAETQNIYNYGAVWDNNCFAGIVPGQTPSPTASTPSPAGTWAAYKSNSSTATLCSQSYTVDDTVVDATSGRRCYKVTCGTALLIRYPEHDVTCNAYNYGFYCDPSSGSTYYQSSESVTPDTIYINLATTGSLSIPFQARFKRQLQIFTFIDTYNTVSNSQVKDAWSVARSLQYIWQSTWTQFAGLNSRSVGFGYNSLSNLFVTQQGFTWFQSDMATAANSFNPSVPSSTTSTVLQGVTTLLNTNLGWADYTFKHVWVVTTSAPTASDVTALNTAMQGSGKGITLLFAVTTTTLQTQYQNTVCSALPAARCYVVVSAYPDLVGPSSSQIEGLASVWLTPIITKTASTLGRFSVVEQDDTYNFVSPVSDTWLLNGNSAAPDWSTKTGVAFDQFYATNPAVFALPNNWVGPSSAALMPLTINFLIPENGQTIKTIVSWNEPPKLQAPTLYYSFKDTDGVPFLVSVVDSIRSHQDPNVNLLKIRYLSQTFTPSQTGNNWVNQMTIYGGTADWSAFTIGTDYFNSLGLRIYPKNNVAGNMTLTYEISDGCLTSPVGTIQIMYTLSNTPPTAAPKTVYVNAGSLVNFNMDDVISDTQTADANLKIMLISMDPSNSYSTLNYGTGPYSPVPIDGATSNTAFRNLQYVAASTAPATTVTYKYRVYDTDGAFAESFIYVVINRPPVLTVTPTTTSTSPLTTVPGQTGSWTVTVTDTVNDVVSVTLETRTISPTGTISTYVTTLSSSNLNSGTVDLLTAGTSANFLTGITLSSGSVNIPMNWSPNANFPYGTVVQLKFSATDQAGLKSNLGEINLGIPDNQPPVWTTTSTTVPVTAPTVTTPPNWAFTFAQDVPKITFDITGTDPNPADTDRLTYTVTTFPPKGGSLFYLDQNRNEVQLTAANPTIPRSADISTTSDGFTRFTIVYKPPASYATATSASGLGDSWQAVWNDPQPKQSPSGRVTLAFTLVNKAPTCASPATFTATQGVNLDIPVSGSDPDGNLASITIVSVTYATGGSGSSTFTYPADGSTIVANWNKGVVSGQPWKFRYLTSRYTVVSETFTYRVTDSGGLTSSDCTVTVQTTLVNQRPTTVGFTYNVAEGDTISIPIDWIASSSSSPTYFDVDGSIAATTVTVTSVFADSGFGTLTTTSGAAVTAGMSFVGAEPTLTFVATKVDKASGMTTDTFKFTARDAPSNGLTPLTSNEAIVTINILHSNNPPTIELQPSTLTTTPTNIQGTFTVTVKDVDSDTATVYFRDISTPFSSAPSYATWTTLDVYDPSGTSVQTWTPSSRPTTVTPGTQILTLTKTAGTTNFPSFTIMWDASGFTSSQSGQLAVSATTDGTSTGEAVGNLQYNHVPPPNQPPTSMDVLIVVNEDSCLLASGCAPGNFRGLFVNDGNFVDLSGETLHVKLQASAPSLPGKFVYQQSGNTYTGRVVLPLPTTLYTPFISASDASTGYTFPLSYEPALNENSGTFCTCTQGLNTVDFAQCSSCTPYTIPFTVVDSQNSETTTYNVRIVILPQPDSPVSLNYEFTAVVNETLPITIVGTDADGDVSCIRFLSFSFQDSPTVEWTSGALATGTLQTNVDYCTMTSTSPLSFPFQFTSSNTNAITDVIRFIVIDSGARQSPEYTVTITMDRKPLPPTAVGGSFTTDEDVPVTIPITFDATAPPTSYQDRDNIKEQLVMTILTVPPSASGTLEYSGSSVVANQVISSPNPVFTFVPSLNWNGMTQFTFKVTDPDLQDSNVATVSITVTDINDPPTIVLTPLSIVRNRTESGTFTVEVNDPDSTTVGVLLRPNFNVPLGPNGEWSTFVFQDDGTSVPTSGLIRVVTLPSAGTPVSFDIVWTPSAAYPDDLTGSFTLYAANNVGTWDLTSVTDVTGTVAIDADNQPPVVIEDVNYPYTYSDIDRSWTEHIFHLVGTDPDAYHADVLTVTIDSIPAGVILLNALTGVPLQVGDVLSHDPSDPTNDDQTWAAVKIVPPVDGYVGNTSFSFHVTDLVGANSATKEVPISLVEGNYPPETNDEVLILTEDYCTTSFCGIPSTFDVLSSLTHATITISDKNNNDAVWIQFFNKPGDTIAENGVDVTLGGGTIGWFPQSNDAYSQLTKVGTFTKPIPNNPSSFDIWFQPTKNANSLIVDATYPHAAQSGGVYYAPYSRLTYRAYDIDPEPVTLSYGTQAEAQADCGAAAVCEQQATDPAFCTVEANLAWTCTDVPDVTGHSSDLHTLWIYVIPINDPPDSNSLTFNINEDDYTVGPPLEIDIPFVDVDSTADQIGVSVLGFSSTSQGTFYTQVNGVFVPLTGNGTEITVPGDRKLFYRPPPDAFSPTGTPLATVYFKVYDQTGALSPMYDAKIYVASVPDQPEWVGDAEITILEDSQALITLSGRDVSWTSADSGNGVIFLHSVGKGTFQQCSPKGCVQLVNGQNLPFHLSEGRITYNPLPNENGLVNGAGAPTYFYTNFTFTLYVYPDDATVPVNVTEADMPGYAIPLTINYKINVLPVNDPPVLVPLWAVAPGVNECDEDTYIRIRFTATDIDSDCNTLEAETLLTLDPLQASLYSCAADPTPACTTDPYFCLSTPDCATALTSVANCKVANKEVGNLGRIQKVGSAQWEVSFVPEPNWNGNLRMSFVVWDECGTAAAPECDLSSAPQTLIIHVRPINDPPSIVKGATSSLLEYYNYNGGDATPGAPPANKRAKFVPKAPGQDADLYTAISVERQEGSFEIHAELSQDGRVLPGTLLEENKVEVVPVPPVNPDPSKPMVTIHRLRTSLQDIDFFFSYSLLVEASLIQANFVSELFAPSAPCQFTAPFSLVCDAEIRQLNSFTGSAGFAIELEEGATSALGLFLLNDTGNVDKLDRPEASGFTIVIIKDEEDDALAAPLAAIVILPVIAAVTAASIAAAWILLGNRAQEYAHASFDAFTVNSSAGGTKSPLYDDLGREARSPLYAGQGHGHH